MVRRDKVAPDNVHQKMQFADRHASMEGIKASSRDALKHNSSTGLPP
jgi:hypothetical protein